MLWIAVKSIHYGILDFYISKHRNMLVTESFLKSLIKVYGRHDVYSDGNGAWCHPEEACNLLGLKRKLHTLFEET
jgi:transposase-like protein